MEHGFDEVCLLVVLASLWQCWYCRWVLADQYAYTLEVCYVSGLTLDYCACCGSVKELLWLDYISDDAHLMCLHGCWRVGIVCGAGLPMTLMLVLMGNSYDQYQVLQLLPSWCWIFLWKRFEMTFHWSYDDEYVSILTWRGNVVNSDGLMVLLLAITVWYH